MNTSLSGTSLSATSLSATSLPATSLPATSLSATSSLGGLLNVDQYTTEDLKKFLKIDASNPNKKAIEAKANELIEKLVTQNTSDSGDDKKNMLQFIQQAKEKLLQSVSNTSVSGSGSRTALTQMPFQMKTQQIDNISSTMKPSYSTNPHYLQNTHYIPKTEPNATSMQYKTSMYVFNTLYCDEFLYENRPSNLIADRTGAQDFTFSLTNPIKNVIGVNLSALQYPNVQPTFSSLEGNDKMYIKVEDGTDVSGTIIMPDGYYNATYYGTGVLNNYMPPVLEQTINVTLYGSYIPMTLYDPNQVNTNNPFAVIISSYTNRVTIINTNGIPFTMVFDMPDWDSNQNNVCSQKYPYYPDLPEYYLNNKLQPNTLGFQMGYRAIVYQNPYNDISGNNSSGNPVNYTYYTCEAQYDDSNGGYVYFSMNEFATNYIDEVNGVFPNYFFDKNVLAIVPINSPHFTNTIDTGANFIYKSRNYTGPIDISKIVVAMYDSNGVKIAFNQIPFSFVLQFKTLYENPALMQKENVQITPQFSSY